MTPCWHWGSGEVQAIEEKTVKKKQKEEKKGKKALGYDLSGRRPGAGHNKRKYAADDAATAGPIRDYFLKTVQSSQAKGSPRKRVCGPATAKMHWYALRQYCGWLKEKGHLDNYVKKMEGPNESPETVSPVALIADMDLLTLYFKHFEQDFTSEGPC